MDKTTTLEQDVERLLACPRCLSKLEARGGTISCRADGCEFLGAIAEGVVLAGETNHVSFFDDRHQVMQRGNEGEGVRCLCYERQARFVQPYLAPGAVVLDAGCGPALPYTKDPGCFLIGIDPSIESVRANEALDLRVYGTAAALPIPNHSLDAVLCFYSIHHVVGSTVRDTHADVRKVLSEFSRVIKPGGHLLIFEVSPWWPFWLAEQMTWDTAKRILKSKLDMYFWSAASLSAVAQEVFPNAKLTIKSFGTSSLSTFPPIFAHPWLRVPRFLYPFHVRSYQWTL